MADLSDVEKALVGVIGQALFPGTYLPTAYTTSNLSWTYTNAAGAVVSGSTITLYRGWPTSSKLDADLAIGTAHISVFPQPSGARNVTRYQRDWNDNTAPTVTLTATVAGATVTIGGTPAAGQIIGVKGFTFVAAYAVLANDTTATIATALAALISGASAIGSILTVPSTVGLLARVVGENSAVMPLRQQIQPFVVSIWAPSPAARDTITGAVDVAIAQVRNLTFPDGSLSGPVIYGVTSPDDKPGKDRVWRRDLRVRIEYTTTATQTFAQMLFGDLTISGPDQANDISLSIIV